MASEAERARSFGGGAEGYDRFRPAPPPEVLDWLLPEGAARAVDVGAGTGALTRSLVARVGEVTAVEPDPRMAAVLARAVPQARVQLGVAEALPLADGSQDAVLASSSWHWVDPARALPEVARVLRVGGRLGVLWTGIDRADPWGLELMGLLGRDPGDRTGRGRFSLTAQGPFSTPQERHHAFTLTLGLDDLVGLAGTFSQVLVLPEAERAGLLEAVGARLTAHPALAGGSVAVPMGSRLWRTERLPG